MACTNKSTEAVLFSSYEAVGEDSANAKLSFVCYSKAQLKDLLTAFRFDDGLRSRLEQVNFEENLVCAIKDFKIVNAVGRGDMGFIRVKQEPTNGVGLAIIKRKGNRFHQFNKF